MCSVGILNPESKNLHNFLLQQFAVQGLRGTTFHMFHESGDPNTMSYPGDILQSDHKMVGCNQAKSIESEYQAQMLHDVHDSNADTCPVCNAVFSNRGTLLKHVQIHTSAFDIPKHICKECGQRFSYGWVLQRHIREVHNKEKRNSYRCKVCGASFSVKKFFMEHITSNLPCSNFYAGCNRVSDVKISDHPQSPT
jgi:uncharacterized C2H2 Zn-finger protein